MRIITGRYKNKAIYMPKGIRPTQNKVRKAVFDILGDISGLSFLELFAGSGSIGLEALSRGIERLVMVESERACQQAIRRNMAELAGLNYLKDSSSIRGLYNCRIGGKECILYPMEAEKAVKFLDKNREVFDIIFLDPPYYKDLAKKTLQMLEAYDIVTPYGFVIIQHFKRDCLSEGNNSIGKLERFKQSSYGDTVLSFYRKKG